MKTKKKVTNLLTAEEAVNTMKEYAHNTSQLKKLEAQIEMEVQKVKDKFKEHIENYQARAKEASDLLIHYAEFNSKKIFAEGKTVDLLHGVLILRTGTPKVDKLRSLTWEAAIEKLRKISDSFVRDKSEVNKEAIIEVRDDVKLMERINAIGISVVQDETITVKSKEEQLVDA
jgi:phage host-nuclease inhibitor protein Gam